MMRLSGIGACARALLVLTFVLLALPGSRAYAEQTCLACHKQQRDPRLRVPTVELPSSVHGHEGVQCSDCHGGRPDEPSLRAHDPEAHFRPRALAGQPQEVCGTCHSDKKRMAEADASVPTDQLELYENSVHGKALARGNARAATCATCHGSHDVKKVNDPLSRVNRANVAATCGHCHSDAELMDSVKMPHDQERAWRHSVHGQRYALWLQSHPTGVAPPGERHPPTCIDCHKDHGIGPRDSATAGCQGCHKAEWDSFSSGPHQKAFKRMGFLPCVDCHGSHEITPVDATLIGVGNEAACRRCHAEGQRMFDDIKALGLAVRAAETAATDARASLASAPVRLLAVKLQPVDEAQTALRTTIHTLDIKKIKAAAAELTARAVKATVPPEPASTKLEQARVWTPVIIFALGLAVLLFGVFGRRGGGDEP
ncbi:MAG TPA: multiheme c-type cytochrome [Polyangiales bacterium]